MDRREVGVVVFEGGVGLGWQQDMPMLLYPIRSSVAVSQQRTIHKRMNLASEKIQAEILSHQPCLDRNVLHLTYWG